MCCMMPFFLLFIKYLKSKFMKKALKFTLSFLLIEAMFFVSLYLMFSLFNWSFITKEWDIDSLFVFEIIGLIGFLPSIIIVENTSQK